VRRLLLHALATAQPAPRSELVLSKMGMVCWERQDMPVAHYGWLEAPGNVLQHPQFQKHWTLGVNRRKLKVLHNPIACHSL